MTKQELRGQLRKALGMCDDKACKSKCTQQLDKAIKLIEAYAADIEREARIDEQLHKILSHYIGNYVTADEYESDVKEAGQAIQVLIVNQVREARIDGIREYADALIDLFVNPPAELGAAEDMHLHPWQIKNMILESLNHLDELKGDNK